MKFSEWLKLKEDAGSCGATTTASIAGFARPIFAIARRDDIYPKKHKKKV